MGKLRDIATGFGWQKIPNDARSAMLAGDAEIERLREALIRIEDLTQHGMGMDASEETVVWREAHNALKHKERDDE